MPQAAGPPPGRMAARARARREASGTRWLVIWALVAEVVIIAGGCNQWVTKKVVDWAGFQPQGLAHQVVSATQTFSWRLTKAAGEHTDAWLSSFVLIAALLAITALLIFVMVRLTSFWRAGIATVVIVTFATQVASVLSGLTYSHPGVAGLNITLYSQFGYQALDQTGAYSNGSTLGAGGGALFGPTGPTPYRFVGGVLLGLLVGIVVGIVARRLAVETAAPAAPPLWPSQTFFPPGEMQRTYEASVTPQQRPLAAPGSFAQRPADDEPPAGRHSSV